MVVVNQQQRILAIESALLQRVGGVLEICRWVLQQVAEVAQAQLRDRGFARACIAVEPEQELRFNAQAP